ncbi:MAG: OsmC family protein [Dehalococcoidia bacterium]
MTLRLYAERKGWDLGEVTIDLSHEKSVQADGSTEPPVDLIRLHIKSTGKLDEEQAERLRIIAGRCPVHRTLMATPEITEEFEVVAG